MRTHGTQPTLLRRKDKRVNKTAPHLTSRMVQEHIAAFQAAGGTIEQLPGCGEGTAHAIPARPVPNGRNYSE